MTLVFTGELSFGLTVPGLGVVQFSLLRPWLYCVLYTDYLGSVFRCLAANLLEGLVVGCVWRSAVTFLAAC